MGKKEKKRDLEDRRERKGEGEEKVLGVGDIPTRGLV